MSEKLVLSEEQQKDLQTKKQAHDFVATAVHLLSTRVQFFHEEFHGANNTIEFLKSMVAQMRKDIEQIEPPVKEEAKPYNMDLTHVKADANG